MVNRPVDVDVDRLWDEFHAMVNMTSEQLRAFLMAEAAGPDGAVPDEPDLGIPEPGAAILAVLAKRKVDLTSADLELIRSVIDQVNLLLAARPAVGLTDDQWRGDLMSLGHDPLRDESA
jgi:hypothetical protein